MSQKKQILNYLKTHKSITQMQAVDKFHAYRLSSIIFNLKHKGFDIMTIREKNDGNKGTHAKYILCKK